MTTYISLDISLNSPSTLVLSVTGFIGTIEWGDGEVNTYSISTNNPSRSYSSAGIYTVNLIDVTQLISFGLVPNNSVYTNSLTNFSYLVQIPTLTNLSNLFNSCTNNFTINFSINVTSNVTNMAQMFRYASNFNQPINFNTQNVTNMYAMLGTMNNFNSSLNFTDTSKVTNMQGLFYDCTLFNQDVSFNTTNVTDMRAMFYACTAFNKPVNFNTSNVTDMNQMFQFASSFNQPLNFNTSNVTDMSQMFRGTTSFNNSLNLTPIPKLITAQDIFTSSGLSIANYSNLLMLWGSQSILEPNVLLGGSSIKYNSTSQTYRNILTSAPNNWTITDGGLSSGPLPTITNVDPSSCLANATPTVTITGTNLDAGSVVQFDSSNATISSISSTEIICTAPASSIGGTVSLKVTTNFGQATTPFTYISLQVAPTITNFSIPSKVFGDYSFNITDPSSNSSGAFSYTSSNTSVAIISGKTITIVGSGTSVITATQAATANYFSGDISNNFIVTNSSPLNPVIITTGSDLEYFLTTTSIYSDIIDNIIVNNHLKSSTEKLIFNTSDNNINITKNV